MLEAIAETGRILALKGDPLDGLIKPAKKGKEGEEVYLVTLDFYCQGEKPALKVDILVLDDQKCREFCWVGKAVGNKPQVYLTADQPDYILGPAITNLLACLKAANLEQDSLFTKLEWVREEYYTKKLGSKVVLDLEKLDLVGKGFFQDTWEQSGGDQKKAFSRVTGAFKAKVLGELGIKAGQAGLWTVLVDGQTLAQDPRYREVVLQLKEGALEGKKQKKKSLTDPKGYPGYCGVCGHENHRLSTSFTCLTVFKFYITDKLGFASGVTPGGFKRNFAACPDCMRGLLQAEKYYTEKMSLRVGNLSFLLIPSFIKDANLGRRDLETWSEILYKKAGAVVNAYQWMKNISDPGNLETELSFIMEQQPWENLALLNFLFYRRSQSEFRVLGLIQDVTPSRLKGLFQASRMLSAWADEHLWLRGYWLDLTTLHRLILLRDKKGEAQFKKLLLIYQALLTGKQVSYQFLVGEFVSLARAYRTGGFKGTNLTKPPEEYKELEMGRRLLQSNLLLAFLDGEKLLRGGPFMKPGSVEGSFGEEVPEEMRPYLHKMKYTQSQAALFLLGELLYQVGSAQGKKGYSHKPVLEKIKFSGMKWNKVMKLANQVVEMLRAHDLFRWNEGRYALMKKYLDANRGHWDLLPEENVFYILSGYAFGTCSAVEASKARVGKNEGTGEE